MYVGSGWIPPCLAISTVSKPKVVQRCSKVFRGVQRCSKVVQRRFKGGSKVVQRCSKGVEKVPVSKAQFAFSGAPLSRGVRLFIE
jgi:hypothetical protein